MESTLTRSELGGGAPLGPSAKPPAPPSPVRDDDDCWPHTSRVLPWMLAGFLVMVWIVPFDSIRANVNLPVDAKLDRLAIVALTVMWVAAIFAGGRASPRWHRGGIDMALLGFLGVAVLSTLLNVAVLANVGDLSLSIKKLSVLASLIVFFFIAATSLRPKEVGAFVKLLVGLSLLMAAGLVYQKYTADDPFTNLAGLYTPGGAFTFTLPLVVRAPNFVAGPTLHPLAAATMLSMTAPFALVFASRARTPGRTVLWLLVSGMLVYGIFATGRKSGDYALLFGMLAMFAARPRVMIRFVPIAFVAVAIAFSLHPRAVTIQIEHLNPSTASKGASSERRKASYGQIVPDVKHSAALGRGYGSYDPDRYKILDNNVLSLLIETGLVGLGSLLAVLLTIGTVAWRATRSHDPLRSDAALACLAGTAAFGVTLALYDTFSYPQSPYMLLFLAALVVVTRVPGPHGPAVAQVAAMIDRATRPLPARVASRHATRLQRGSRGAPARIARPSSSVTRRGHPPGSASEPGGEQPEWFVGPPPDDRPGAPSGRTEVAAAWVLRPWARLARSSAVRILVSLAFLAAIAAALGGGSSATHPPAPLAPVPATDQDPFRSTPELSAPARQPRYSARPPARPRAADAPPTPYGGVSLRPAADGGALRAVGEPVTNRFTGRHSRRPAKLGDGRRGGVAPSASTPARPTPGTTQTAAGHAEGAPAATPSRRGCLPGPVPAGVNGTITGTGVDPCGHPTSSG